MQIRTLITIGGAIGIAAIVAAMAVGYSAYVDISNGHRQNVKITKIEEASSELSILTGEYLLYRAERAEAQWLIKHESLGLLLASYGNGGDATENQNTNRLMGEHAEAKQVFTKLIALVANDDSTKKAPIYAPDPLEARLATQLLTSLHTMVGVSSRMVGHLAEHMDKIILDLLQTLTAIFVGIALLLIVAWVITRQRIAQPVEALHSGIDAIASGDLDHRIVQHYQDEIGSVAVRINTMAKNLKETLVSRDALVEEVAQRQKIEASLRSSETNLTTAQHIAHLGSWEWDIVSNELAWSDEIYRIFGLIPQEFSATYDAFIAAVHPDDQEKVKQAIAVALSEHAPYTINHRVVRPDGTERTVHERGEVQFDDSGKPTRMIGTVHDITERQRMEKRLRKSEKMESILGLAAGMAHELNNPLGAILQNTQNLSRRLSSDLQKNVEVARELGIEPEQISAYMEKRKIPVLFDAISEAGERASGLIKKLVGLSQATPKEKTNANVVDLIEAAISMAEGDYDLEHTYLFRDIEIVREFSSALPAVLCQTDEIERVILAVLSNAAQAMLNQDQPARITVRTMRHDQQASIEIEDNGPGMDQDVQKRIFEPFYTTSSPQRKGLGLSTAFSVVCDSHDGQIRVKSEPNKGTIIIIELPFGEQ